MSTEKSEALTEMQQWLDEMYVSQERARLDGQDKRADFYGAVILEVLKVMKRFEQGEV